MLHEVENAGVHIAKLSASVYGVNMLPDFLNVNGDGNLVTRSLKRGFLLYVANEAVEQLTTGDSNFNKMSTVQGWKNLGDDTFFFGLASGTDEQFGITRAIASNIPSLEPNMAASLAIGAYMYGVKTLGTKLENSAIKSITSLFA